MQPATDVARTMVPRLGSIVPQILIAGVLPIVGYALLRPHVPSDAVALAAVAVFPIALVLAERLWRGRYDPIGVISLIGIGVGLVGALALNGDPLLLKIKESLVTGLFGVACLVSLSMRRPLMFYLSRSFATGGDPEKTREFDKRWDMPTVPRRFRFSTAVWGTALVGEAIVRTVLAISIPTQRFLILAQVINWSVLAGLFWFTILYSRAGARQVAILMAKTT
jgi:hypothetical protein